MGKPQRFDKQYIPVVNGTRVTARNSLVGTTVIGDYLDIDGSRDADAQTLRVLVFERPEPPAKATVARRKHRKTTAQVNENEVAAAAQQRDLSKERA